MARKLAKFIIRIVLNLLVITFLMEHLNSKLTMVKNKKLTKLLAMNTQ